MPCLSVFFATLEGWAKIGSLHRTLDIYRKFAEEGWEISFYTYDSTSKLLDAGFPVNIVSYAPTFLYRRLRSFYQVLVAFLYLGKGKRTSVIITNHLYYPSPAIMAGRLWGAKVIARCGMVYGESAEKLGKSGKGIRKKIYRERLALKHADKCFIPTRQLADWVVQNYGIEHSKIVVVPNYVDTNLFKPSVGTKKDIDVICVGRLVPKKRHKLLLEALASSKVKINIIGQGKLEEELNDFARRNALNIFMTPRAENRLLPFQFNRSKIYVNMAEWEGHPKALIEAMACGCACIGARSPGIENLIIDGKTGFLVEPEPENIRNKIKTLLKDDELRKHLGKNARDYAVKHFSLERVYEQYKKVFEEIMAQ